MLKRIFFDFGGCIDAPGIHTRMLFWDAFLAEKLTAENRRAEFQDAYSAADQRMMKTGEAKSMALKDFNRHNSALIAEKIGVKGAEAAGDRVTALMKGYIAESKAALETFRESHQLSVISNFTGNLDVILREFGLREFFDTVTESFYAGASKPDLRIFHAALAAQNFAAADCMYVGDNPVNDIAPAKLLGMKTALIHPPGKKRDCGADFYVEDLRALSSAIQRK